VHHTLIIIKVFNQVLIVDKEAISDQTEVKAQAGSSILDTDDQANEYGRTTKFERGPNFAAYHYK